MAIGTVVSTDQKRAICLAAAIVADQAAPTSTPAQFAASSAADGVPVHVNDRNFTADTGHSFPRQPAKESTLLVDITGTGTLVGTVTLWGYLAASSIWYEIPLNGGTTVTPIALAETATDKVTYTAQLANIGHYDRVALQVASLGGTNPVCSAWLVCSMEAY